MHPLYMGILNVTPDSFSDGGQFTELDRAVAHADQMVSEGASWIDVGGESTRPGSVPVPLEEEIARVIPVIERLASRGYRVSIDTSKPLVAQQAIASGATLVNDVTGARDPRMLDVVVSSTAELCLMHMHRTPDVMMAEPMEDPVVPQVLESLSQTLARAESHGIARERIYLDPGIGFGKTTDQNVQLVAAIPRLQDLGLRVLIGVSRKAFIGRWFGSEENPLSVAERAGGTALVEAVCALNGANIIRTHDVKNARLSWELMRRSLAEAHFRA